MKKVLAVLSFMTLLLFSCTNDENSNPNITPTNDESSILLKKIISENNGNITTSIYSYDGNKIVSVSNDNGDLTKFTYTGNLITKMEIFENNTLVETNIYEYDTNERLTLLKNYQGTTTDTLWFYEEFVSNSDGTTTVNHYYVDFDGEFLLDNNNNPYIFKKDKFYFENNEIIKRVRTEYELNNGVQTEIIGNETTNWTYDDKNYYFKNVVGLNKLISKHIFKGYNYQHNILSSNDEGSVITATNSYTYNSDNFPVTCIRNNGSGNLTNIQYIY